MPSILVLAGLGFSGWTFAAERPSPFSALPIERQRAIEERLAPPPLSSRDAPYSTPMYYLLARGYADGIKGELQLEHNRPDWQEVLIRDWVDLGLTSTLFLATPSQWDHPETIQAIRDYFELSARYGLRIGVRLGGDERFPAIEGSGWTLHPENPQNRIAEYAAWCRRLAELGKGRVDHYIVGDEVNLNSWEEPTGDGGTRRGVKAPEARRWTPAVYMTVFTQISEAIKPVDPQARLSMFGMGDLDWPYVEELLGLGYARHADGVAANFGHLTAEQMRVFARKIRSAQPRFGIYSNGVGYVGAKDTNHFPPNPGSDLCDDRQQASRVAKVMFKAFEAGWSSAPYYIAIRQWVLPDGTSAPHWYGFMGFTDLLVDREGHLTTKRYPAWYAFQTVSHVFWSQSKTRPADFAVECRPVPSQSRVLVRNNYECLLVLWNDTGGSEIATRITLPNRRYTYPVRIPLLNYRQPVSLAYEIDAQGRLVIPDVPVGEAPVLIRLVAEEQTFVSAP